MTATVPTGEGFRRLSTRGAGRRAPARREGLGVTTSKWARAT